jgi:hypothetical protein
MTLMKNSEKLLDKIASQEVPQKSRKEFVLRNIFFWSLFVLSILIGGISFSVILFAFGQTEFDLIAHITHSKIEFFLGLLPFFWIVTSVVLFLVSIFGIRHTKTGYRYSSYLIFGSSILLSIILGTSIYYTGGAERIERIFAENVPLYKGLEEKRIALWSMPEEGFLSGVIIEKGDVIKIEDWDGKLWDIDISDAIVRGRVSLEVDEKIKIIGQIIGDDSFTAKEVRPWDGQGNGKNVRF